MKILIMTALFASTVLAAPREPEFVDVFVAGKNGFPAVRIPSIVVTKSGALLAFAEGRQNLGDQAENKIIERRSVDGGKTWSETSVLADDGKRPLNNPCAVVDERSGRVLLMFQSYPERLKEASGQIKTGYEGDDIVKSYLMQSDDEGARWSAMREVTRQVKRPEKVTTIASGPGIGVQLQSGRLLMPFNEGPFGKWNIYAAYSDDGGKTWQRGDIVSDVLIPNEKGGTVSTVNECQLVELSDGSVRFNARRWGGKAVRKTSLSRDGGQTWSPVEDAPDLVDPGCMASILRVPAAAPGQLLYSGPRSTKRENGTIYLSADDGKTWPLKKTLFAGSFAYSVLCALPDGTFGCLFEADNASRIVFARFSLDWLREPV